jgi:iron complex outermembrane recepter protein
VAVWKRGLMAAAATAVLAAAMAGTALAQPGSDEIIVTGVRGGERTVLSSPVPVDVLSAEALENAGAVGNELGQALTALAPSFNFPRQSNSGTSDHIRAGQLRGLSPDQTLVLVNGRRRHQSAVVNTETKIGRGTAAVDFNTIPLGAVGRIEVLRDGAGAQYGSDAIAGVINVILDDAPEGGELTITYGQHNTNVEAIRQDLTDGETLNLAAEGALALGERGGFVRFGIEALDREGTNRAGFDLVPFFEEQTPANLALAGRRNYAIGDPSTNAWNLWYNAELPAGGFNLYSFATYANRTTEGGAAFLRYPDSFQNIRSVYPNGYRPQTTGDNEDLSVVGGATWALGAFDVDASIGYGRNEFGFGVENSLNPSLGPSSPTSFDSGTYIFDQLTANVDLQRELDFGFTAAPAIFAVGVEYRRETYETKAGEPASYIGGPFTTLAVGAQAAPGLTPADVVDIDRDVFSIYTDLSGDVTERLYLSLAARYEDYSDFGDATTAKLAGLFTIVDGWNLRAAVSNSVRAPGLQQIGFSDTTQNFGTGGSLVRTRTLRVDDPIARALGATDLKPEESVNYSVGTTAAFGNFTLSLDAYRIEVDDRITLSDRFFGTALENFVQSRPGGANVRSVRFFTNAIDTETNGVDVVLDYLAPLFSGDLALSLAYSNAETEITRFAPTPAALRALDPTFRLVGVEERNTIETAAPTEKVVASAEWSNETWRGLVRVNYYGDATRVFDFGGGFEPTQTYGSELQLDLEGEVQITPEFAFTIGASNVLDEYPDRSSDLINYFGNLPYDILSPVGVNGRFVYARAKVTF